METKRNFVKGVMNKSLDDRLVPDGYYIDALNIKVSSTDGSDAGTAQNFLGNLEKVDVNTLLSDEGFTPQVNIYPIGSFTDTKNNNIYWFLTSATYDMILKYHEADNGTATGTLVMVETRSGGIMNFSQEYLITGVNLVDNLLFFTDGLNEPRRIDVGKSYRDANISDDTVNVIMKPPLSSPAIELVNDEADPANNLQDKFIRFAYRYRYVNNEISALSPFSKTAFEAQNFTFDFGTGRNESMQNQANSVNITVDLGSSEVEKLEIVMKDSMNKNVQIVTSIDRASNIAFGQTYVHKFKNNKVFSVLPDSQVNRLFDNVPLRAKAQDLIGRRIVYGNYRQFFDIKKVSGEDIVTDFNLLSREIDITSGTSNETFKSGRDYELGIAYLDDFGRMTTVLESEKSDDTVNIPITKASKQNQLYTTIAHKAPAFASKYRLFIKQNRGTYYNILPTGIVTDGLFVYILIPKYDIDKVHKGDLIYIKATPSGTKQDSHKYKVLEAEMKPKNFLGEQNDQIQDEGYYIKLKVEDATYFSADSFYTLKDEGYGLNSQVTAKKSKTIIHKTTSFLLQNVAYVDTPIFYGKGSNKSLSIIRFDSVLAASGYSGAQLYNLDTDRRIILEITDTNKFSWRDYRLTTYYGTDITMNSAVLPGLFGGAGGNNLTINVGGQVFSLAYISWDTSKNYTVGDRFVLNYRGNKFGIFGTPVLFDSDSNIWWSGAYTCAPNRGTLASNDGDLTITPGTIIELQVKETTTQDVQRFISQGSYENIEEWFFEERIYEKYVQYTADGKPDGSRAVFFRRGFVKDQNITGKVSSVIRSIDLVGDERGYIMMCVKGYDTNNLPASVGDQKSITFNMKIRRPDNITILETEGEVLPDNVYYELPQTYPILPGYLHGKNLATDTDQSVLNPAIITIEDFNAITFGNGMESSIIEDVWNGAEILPSPRANAAVDRYEQIDAENSVTYSGVYNESSSTNNLNQFNLSLANFKALEKEYGSIQKLYARDTDLVVFQEDKVSKVLFGKNLLSDSIGGGSIASIPEVLGTQIAYSAEFGISNNPESFAKWGNDVFFTDQKRGAVLNLTQAGIKEISTYGMRSWFRDMFDESPSTQKLGAFDPYEFMYVLSSNEIDVAQCSLSVSNTEINVSGDAFSSGFLFSITSNTDWVITLVDTGDGTSWLTLNQTSGNGNAGIAGEISSNVGAPASRSLTIRVTACGQNTDITFTQSNEKRKEVIVVKTGDKTNDGQKSTLPSYNYGSGNVGNVQSPIYLGGDYVFSDTRGGIVGSDGIPNSGDSVDIIGSTSFGTATLPEKPFNPNLGNKMYYLDTNTVYDETQGGDIIAAGTEVPSYTLVGGEYKGNFTYTATNDRLYIVVDYTNTLDHSDVVTAIPAPTNGLYETINVNNANNIGNYTVTYSSTSTDIRFVVENAQGAIIADSGYVSTPSSQVLNVKKSISGNDIIKVYNNVTSGSPTFDITIGAISLTSALIGSTGYDTASESCAGSGTQTIYHDGAAADPVAGDVIYSVSDGSVEFDGGNQYFTSSTNTILINQSGLVLSIQPCACSETEAPAITQTDIFVDEGVGMELKIAATNNPTSYAAAGNARQFSLYGGTGGAVFSGQDSVTGITKQVFVSSGDTIEVCFWIGSVYIVSGPSDASFTDLSGCILNALPGGVTFDTSTGVIAGTPDTIGRYTFTVNATNCFGTGADASFDIVVGPGTPPTAPFSVDQDNPQTTSALACALTPSYSIMYHDGILSYPVIRDTVYEDELGAILFVGADNWYLMENGIAIKVGNDGIVSDTFQCDISPSGPVAPTWTSGGSVGYDSGDSATSCAATSTVAVYYTGTYGVNPGKLSLDPSGSPYATAGWYKHPTNATTHYWDGSQWTNAADCLP